MQLPLYQIDAFTDQLFKGNPAAVVPLTQWLPDSLMQAIAAENNLAETAFFVPLEDDTEDFQLRWFTPEREMDLCGHATLASAYVLFEYLLPQSEAIRFKTLSGTLVVTRSSAGLTMDFPARPARAEPLPDAIARALNVEPLWSGAARDWLVVLDSEQQVRELAPDFATLLNVSERAVIVTAPGTEADFVSRFFAPKLGVFEDPVTGSAHCTLVPYWVERLQKNPLHARQISARGGDIQCLLQGKRVFMTGTCTHYMTAEISI
ncbi:PhzF family phenazine biosynthesis protein [Exilibacterium tricleocarpae]|uniref:PhzF family phenazine biosynthesis protein n=1 Tax=Exilibacterium tricleocarpae TaxID=2591008 RepID=A0A545TVT1_9GAMM|nr:PhzF family phenazine biosynthesis protein [Exilibacterium tricleocarpae]TQV81261.1 PhzF family phenazine biosynthesis protein [Exilibacterium tricleocarpae]